MPTTLQPLAIPVGTAADSSQAAAQAGNAVRLTIARKPRHGAGVYGSAPAGGDGGGDDTMLARIEKLEAGMDRLSDTAHRIDTGVAKLTGLLEAKLPEMATRTDIARLAGSQARLEESFTGLRNEFNIRLPSLATTADIARLESIQASHRAEFETRLPTLATKLDLTDKPNKAWLLTAAATFVGLVTLGVTIGALIGPYFGQWLNS